MINRTHHDLFQKLLQDIARLIAELIGSHTQDPILALEQAKQHYLQFSEKELDGLPPEELLDYLIAKDFSKAQMEITGHFLFAEAKEMNKINQDKEGVQKLKQARVIFEYLEEHSEIYSQERRDMLASFKNLLDG